MAKDTKTYTISEAISKVKETCKCKFDSTIEVHFNLGIDPKKQDQMIRSSVTLPHGTGKTQKVAVFANEKIPNADLELKESDLSKIEKEELKAKVDFDVLVVDQDLMPKIAKLGRVLGPAGVMPNPRNGTVTSDVKDAVDQIKKGKINLKNEQDTPVLHSIIGKRSFTNEQLEENFKELLSTIKQNRPQKVRPDAFIKSCYICSTMSPSFVVSL